MRVKLSLAAALTLTLCSAPAVADTPGMASIPAPGPAATIRRAPLFVGGATLAAWARISPELFGAPQAGRVVATHGGLATVADQAIAQIAGGAYQVIHIQPDHLRDGTGALAATEDAITRITAAAQTHGLRVVVAKPLAFGAKETSDDAALSAWLVQQAQANGWRYADYDHVDFHPEAKLASVSQLAVATTSVRGALDAAFRAIKGLSDAEQFARLRAAMNAEPDGPGSGPYPAIHGIDPALPSHVFYRPGNLALFAAHRLPVVVFGNGGCSIDGNGSRGLLTELASHGYLVIALGQMIDGPGGLANYPDGPKPPADLPGRATSLADMTAAIDWVSHLTPGEGWGRFVDPSRIAVAGWSCGGLLTIQASLDPRVRATIMFDSGLFGLAATGMPGMDVPKSKLAQLHAPILYVLGGLTDVAFDNGTDDFARINSVPAALLSRDVGHSGTFWEPRGGAWAKAALFWLDWQLKQDPAGQAAFLDPHGALHQDPNWTILIKPQGH